MRTVFVPTLVAITTAIAGCVSQRPPSAFDLVSRQYQDGSGSRCEQYAYETGRTRYETERSITGQAFAASNANRAAERAFIRCQSGRPS